MNILWLGSRDKLILQQDVYMIFDIFSGALAWNGDILSSGSRDRYILQRDVRTPSIIPERKLAGHKQEVTFTAYSLSVFILREYKCQSLD